MDLSPARVRAGLLCLHLPPRARRPAAALACHAPATLATTILVVDTAVTLSVKVVPGASRDRVAGRYGDGVKVQTSAPPERGRANAAVAAILAQFLGVEPDQVELISPPANPRKRFRISGLSEAQLADKVATLE